MQQNFTAIGVNNTLNVTPQNASIHLTSIKINLFNSKQGVCIYGFLAFMILLIAWIICFMINPISIFVSFALIPFVFFALGTSYFKYHDDFYHLKIHKILMYIVIATIISIFLLSVLYIKTKLNIQSIAMVVIAINMIASYALYFNLLGGETVIDFIINIFIKIKDLIFKS